MAGETPDTSPSSSSESEEGEEGDKKKKKKKKVVKETEVGKQRERKVGTVIILFGLAYVMLKLCPFNLCNGRRSKLLQFSEFHP